MPVARIVTRHVTHESQALRELSGQLRAAGYDIEVAPPGTTGAAADLVVELDELSASEALNQALELSRDTDADVYIAPGLFAQPATPIQSEASNAPVVEGASAPNLPITIERGGVVGETLEDVGAALADGRAGIRETLSGMRSRVSGVWLQWQQRREEAGQGRRLERERREIERQERRRQRQLELQRQAEEKQRLVAERERLAADRERVWREQMARDAAARAERERLQREAMAQEAQRRAELARAAEQERQRLAVIEADRLRGLREQEAQRIAAIEAERLRVQRDQETQRAAALAQERLEREQEPERAIALPTVLPEPVQLRTREAHALAPEPVFADAAAAPALKPKLVPPTRRVPSARERQWERAVFVASIATLAAMIGYGLAGNIRPASPLPSSLMQNPVQQQVPFGPAKVDLSSGKSAGAHAGKPVVGAVERPRGEVRNKAVPPRAPSKPSPAKPAARQRARRARHDDVVADDEVIVRHAPTSPAQRAQSSDRIRRYSDDN